MSESRQRAVLIVILALNFLLGTAYSIWNPIFEASDEWHHYPLVQHLAANGLALPVQDPAAPALWGQEGSQPPLYYTLAALATLFIDTADFPQVYQVNPHADVGMTPADGNINLVVHFAAREALPWTGTVLAVHVARLLGVLLGTAAVLITYLIGREVFPGWPEAALGAAALHGFLPMFAFISGSVNNDTLSNLLAALLVWQIVRLLHPERTPGALTYAALGITAGAGLLAKVSLGFLLPVVAAALLMVSLRRRDARPVLVGGLISGGLTVLIAGWWYLRNWTLYGDPTGLNVFLQFVGQRAVPADTVQLWSERQSFLRTWWGFFGGINVPLPDGVYTLLNVLGVIAALGVAAFLLAWALRRLPEHARPRPLPLLIVMLWPLIAFAALLRWTSVTWASQGRLLFIAIGPLSLLLAVGLAWWLRRSWARWVLALVAAVFFGAAVYGLFGVIVPAYTPPSVDADLPAGEIAAFYEPGQSTPTLTLVDYTVQTHSAYPGGEIAVRLYWRVEQPPTRRWSLFAHAISDVGTLAAQRDRYPGRGLLRTEAFTTGDRWIEDVVIALPDGLYTPDDLALAVGWYDIGSGERMLLSPDGADLLHLAEAVPLVSAEADAAFPNLRFDNFDDRVALRGYTLDTRQAAPGEDVTITLYWEALGVFERDYTVFVHILDTRTTTIYAGSDSAPAGGAAPTTSWQPGDVIEDVHTLTLAPETPPGVYQIEVGLYTQPEPGIFERLRTVPAPGQERRDFVYLSRVAVTVGEDGP